MARPKKIVENTEVITEVVASDLPELVSLIGTGKCKYMKDGKEYHDIHRNIAIKHINNGFATLKTN